MLLNAVKDLLLTKDLGSLTTLLGEASVDAITQCLRELEPREQVLLFRLLDKERALQVFESLTLIEQSDLVRAMEDPDLIQLVESMDPDERVELFEELPAKVATRVLAEVAPEVRQSLSLLLGYPEDSAGRVMNPDYLALPGDTPVQEALQRLRESPLDPAHVEMVLVLGEGRQYLGYVTATQLLKASFEEPIRTLISDTPAAVSAHASQDQVAEMFRVRQYPLVAVVDKEGRLVGAIDAEKGLELVEEREAQRLTTFGGTVAMGGPDVDIVHSPLMRVFKARVFWLVVLTFFGVITSTFV
jgi:magnesium transporter